MNPSKLRHRITFQRQTKNQNEYGEEIKNEEIEKWVEVITVWASVNPISAKEFFAAEKLNSEITHKINMRCIRSLEITSDMRIKFNDRYFELIGPPINFQERNVELQLLCKELM